MNLHRVLGNMAAAAGSQGVSLVVSLMTSLLVPKVLGVEEFGYWQLFIFYFNYVGAFQFGLNDGVYLTKGGQGRKSLDRRETSSQFAFGLFFQVAIALVVVAYCVYSQLDKERLFVLIACAVLMPLYNAACFFQYLLQAIDETRTYSKSVVLDRALLMVLLCVLLLADVTSFEAYVYAFAMGKLAQFVYCLAKGAGLLSRSLMGLPEMARISFFTMSVGVKLMVANLASTLILGMMRFAIDACWGIEVFSQVSLALSMSNFMLVFITQSAMVLFPTLKKLDDRHLKRFFGSVQNALEILLPSILLLYMPVRVVLGWWLPNYAASFEWLGLLLPLCLFDGKMNALYSTMFKVRRKEGQLLVLNVGTMALSATLAFFGAVILHSIEFVLVSGTVSVIVRSTAACMLLSRDILGAVRIRSGEIALSCIFIAGTLWLPAMCFVVVFFGSYLIYLGLERRSVLMLASDCRGALTRFKSEG